MRPETSFLSEFVLTGSPGVRSDMEADATERLNVPSCKDARLVAESEDKNFELIILWQKK